MGLTSTTIKRIGLVSLGSVGRRHFRLLKSLRPELEVVLVRSGKGGSRPEESLAVATVASVELALSKGIDAAIIASPATFHLQHAIHLLLADIPVLIEKPLSHNLENIDVLQELACLTEAPVVLGYVLRYAQEIGRAHV